MDAETRAALERAKTRLDTLDLYPHPVSLRGVRVLVVPWLFRLPWMRRYSGYALPKTIVLARPLGRGSSDDLVTHELCHVWQTQERPLAVFRAWLTTRYARNPFELEARRAVALTREDAQRQATPSAATGRT
jgi:hypothetical protein